MVVFVVDVEHVLEHESLRNILDRLLFFDESVDSFDDVVLLLS